MPCESISLSPSCAGHSEFCMGREQGGWCSIQLEKPGTHSHMHFPLWEKLRVARAALAPGCAALVRSEWPSKVKLFCLTFFTAPKLRFYFAPMVCRNFSTGLSGSHKSTLLCGWLSKSGFSKGEDDRKVLFYHFDGISPLKWQFDAIYCFPLAVTCLILFTWKLKRRVARFCSILFYHQSNKAVFGIYLVTCPSKVTSDLHSACHCPLQKPRPWTREASSIGHKSMAMPGARPLPSCRKGHGSALFVAAPPPGCSPSEFIKIPQAALPAKGSTSPATAELPLVTNIPNGCHWRRKTVPINSKWKRTGFINLGSCWLRY